jgi:hypothetical protein
VFHSRFVSSKEFRMDPSLQGLDDQVSATTTVEGSAKVLIDGFQARLDAAIAALPNPAKLHALSAALKTSSDALATSVAANTPAVP